MKIFVTTLGTWGDVLPFIYISKRLIERGHDVTFLTNEKFGKNIRKENIPFHAVADENSLNRALDYLVNEGLVWENESKKTSTLKKVIEYTRDIFVKPSKAIYEYIESHYEKNNTVIVSNFVCYGSRYVQEKLKIPTITTVLVPFYFRSKTRPPEQAMMAQSTPRYLKYLSGKFFDDILMYRPIFRKYKDLNMKKFAKYETRFSPDKVVCLVSEFFAHQQADWPKQTVTIGFPVDEWEKDVVIEKELLEFITDGEKPIIFNLGSQHRHDNRVFWESVKVCEKLNRKGIFLGYDEERINMDELPKTVKLVKYLPLTAITEKCAALVCHGGIGTCTAAFKSGIPLLIVPEFPEHWDTAFRIGELGIGKMFNRNEYNADGVSLMIKDLITSKEVKESCAKYAKELRSENTLNVFCDIVESAL